MGIHRAFERTGQNYAEIKAGDKAVKRDDPNDPLSRFPTSSVPPPPPCVSHQQYRSRQLVASGQVGKKPAIFVWNAAKPELPIIARFVGYHTRQVMKNRFRNLIFAKICSLDFSRDGSLLISVGADDSHSIAIWDISRGTAMKMIRDVVGGPSPV
jgi:WD40 repeat protein